MKPKLYIVEGKHDVDRLKRYNPTFKVVSINGSAIDANQALLDTLSQTHEFILCLDPDHPGEKIRIALSKRYPHVSHIYLPKQSSYSKNKRKIGLEHVSDETLDQAFSHVTSKNDDLKSDITRTFLMQMKLINHPQAKEKRKQLCEFLHISPTNGKTLYQRLHWMGITKKQVMEVFNESHT